MEVDGRQGGKMAQTWRGGRVLLHADVDAFFASVELRDRPELRGLPVAVSSEVICAATYEARALGIHGGMRTRAAIELCPDLIQVPVRPQVYAQASEGLFALFAEVASEVEAGSMEEAFLDVSDHPDPVDTARSLRGEARQQLGLPVSIGVGRTRLLAKIGSRRAKPDGLYVISDGDEEDLRSQLTIAELWGIGPRTRTRLSRHGIETVTDLKRFRDSELRAIAGTAMGRRLFSIAIGRDDDQLHQPPPRRSVTAGRTIWPVACSVDFLTETLTTLAESAAARLRDAGRVGTAVTGEITLADSEVISRTTRVPDPTDSATALHAAAASVINDAQAEIRGAGVLYISITVDDLEPVAAMAQLSLPF